MKDCRHGRPHGRGRNERLQAWQDLMGGKEGWFRRNQKIGKDHAMRNTIINIMQNIVEAIIGNKEKYLGLAMLSVIGCLVFSEMLSDFIFQKMAIYHEVKVSGYASEHTEECPIMIDNAYKPEDSAFAIDIAGAKKYGFYGWPQLQGAVLDASDVTYVAQEESEYGYAYYRLNSPESYLTLNLPVYMNTCLTFVFGEHAFPVSICDEKGGGI